MGRDTRPTAACRAAPTETAPGKPRPAAETSAGAGSLRPPANLDQRQQHHERQRDSTDDDLRQGHIRRLEDEEHDPQHNPVESENDDLLQRVAREDYGGASHADEEQRENLEDEHAHAAFSSSGSTLSGLTSTPTSGTTACCVRPGSNCPSSRMRKARAVAWLSTAFMMNVTAATKMALIPACFKPSSSSTAIIMSTGPIEAAGAR